LAGPVSIPKDNNPLAKVLAGGGVGSNNPSSDMKQSQDPTPNLSMGGGVDSILKKKKN
jgi:hypothetical protein